MQEQEGEKQDEIFAYEKNNPELMRQWKFMTNGLLLMMHTQTHTYFFNIKTGMLVYSEPNHEFLSDVNLCYDYTNNTFYGFNIESDDVRVSQITIKNFKKSITVNTDADPTKVFQKFEQRRI
jgi:hypothetical protein